MWRSAAFACVLFACQAQAEVPRDKLQSTLTSLKASKEDEEALRDKLADSAREMKSLRADATALAADVQSAERRVSNEERRYRSVSAKLAAKERDFAARREEYADTLASLMRVQNMPATAMLANPEQTQEVLRTARVMQRVNGALAARAAALRREVETLEKLRNGAKASRDRLSHENRQLTAKQAQLNRELKLRQVTQQRLNQDLAATQKKVASLSKQSANLQELIGKLEANRIAVAPKGTPARIAASPARGRWKVPVAGRVTHRFGQRKSANETYRGLMFSSRPGAAVVAPAAGEVVFTGPFRDYGPMVLLKHGNDRISLLAGLGNIAVSLNQSVAMGEPIGSMGGSPSLYYELREGSKPIDPSGWFGNLGATVAKR